jgi:hypothetical protein
MKIVYGLSALLLGTTLLAGVAAAQNNNGNNNNPPPPPPHGEHGADGPPRSFSGPPPGYHGAPHQNNFAHVNPNAVHGGTPNQARWNHVVTFHDRNVAHFNTQDRAMWTQGQWRHTKHHGRNGWWWYTNGAWFFYDEPTYPYPDVVSDDYSFDQDTYDQAPDQGGYVWYYCNNPPGYYPYVQSCRGPWQPVTPTPPGSYYDQGPQGGPDQYQDEDQGPPPAGPQPQDNYQGGPNTPPPGYDNGDDEDDQGPPPPGYNQDQPPPGYGPPPGYDQPPR